VIVATSLNTAVAVMLIPPVSMRPDFAVPLDLRVLGATLGVSLVCGLFAGLAPSLASAARRAAIRVPIGAAGRGATPGRRLRAVFSAAQLALSLALVTGALLLVATLRNLSAVDLGIDPEGVTLHSLDASRQGYTAERRVAYYQQVHRQLSPATLTTSLSSHRFGSNSRVSVADPAGGADGRISVWTNAVSGAYFDVLGIRLIEGRVFTDAESLGSAAAAPDLMVITDRLARRAFGERSPVGERLVRPATTRAPAREFTVIGVVAGPDWDVGLSSYFNPTGGSRMEIYLPFSHPEAEIDSAVLHVRSAMQSREVADQVARAAAVVDPRLPVLASGPLSAEIDRKLADRRAFAWVTSALGWLGFLLAAVGLYGLLAQSVAERTREFGIRLAIGGSRRHIFAIVVRQAAWIGAVGAVAGVALAYWGSRLIEAQLVGVTRGAPGIYVAAASALVVVVLHASLWPARAATGVNPVEALRAE
jgi:predicted permease